MAFSPDINDDRTRWRSIILEPTVEIEKGSEEHSLLPSANDKASLRSTPSRTQTVCEFTDLLKTVDNSMLCGIMLSLCPYNSDGRVGDF